jgi:hypothetical protein
MINLAGAFAMVNFKTNEAILWDAHIPAHIPIRREATLLSPR